jgi:hypothetical protein
LLARAAVIGKEIRAALRANPRLVVHILTASDNKQHCCQSNRRRAPGTES